MTQIQKYIGKSPLAGIRNTFQDFFRQSEVFTALSRLAVPMGGNLLEREHYFTSSNSGGHKRQDTQANQEVSENRYSVVYTFKSQYRHVGCSSQSEAQSVMGMLMTDEDRIPIGIYDGKTDSFEWEMIGQYFHSQDPIADQQNRLEEVLTISRALRRRDSSWMPGYLQRPSFFA